MIPAELWLELSARLDAALALHASERVAWLDAQARDRPDLEPHLRRLIGAHERPVASDPLRAPPYGLIAEALGDTRSPGRVIAGDMLGPYRLIAPLGEGGMASVWLAEQTLAVKRKVALKGVHSFSVQ